MRERITMKKLGGNCHSGGIFLVDDLLHISKRFLLNDISDFDIRVFEIYEVTVLSPAASHKWC
jgi:hypothetical protein